MSLHFFGILTFLAIGPCSAQPQSATTQYSENELLEQIEEAKSERQKTYAMLLLAEKYRLEERYNEAKSLFSSAGKSKSKSDFDEIINVGIALVYAEQGQLTNVYQTLEENMESKRLLNSQKGCVYAALAKHAFLSKDTESAQYYAEQAKALANDQNRQSISKTLSFIKEKPQQAKPSTTETPQTDSLSSLRMAMRNGDLSQAQTLINALQNQELDEESKAYVEATQKRIDAKDPFFADKVGILLPLSNEQFAPVATSFQQSIELSNSQLSAPFQLVFYDTKGTPEEAVKGVEELVLKEGCSTIIGPLLKETVMEAAHAAQLYEIPMLTLSKENTPLQNGDFIFYVNLSPKTQISNLVRHAITEKKVTRFAMLAPETDLSKELLAIYEEEITRMDGTLVRSQLYPPETTDFRETARIFSDKTDPSIKPEDIDLVPPRADFDVLFIPDNSRKTPLIASALAYEGFKVGTFDAGHDIPKTELIGLNSWNNPKIIRSSGQYMIGALFTDAVWMNSEEEQFVQFKTSFEEALQRKPNIFDAILFDTLQFASLTHTSSSRYEMQSNIQNKSISKALTGGLRFREDRELDRSLILLELKKTGIAPWIAPEE